MRLRASSQKSALRLYQPRNLIHTLAPDDGELGLFDSEGNAGNWFVISEPM